ncbi:MAG: thermonuclease family protein [Pseudomonadota bacterium]|nr:thermonuclease family protein [Pseudomonadota bacterium]
MKKALLFLALLLIPCPVMAQAYLGPYQATVQKVIDGDTFDASFPVFYGVIISAKIRILGIDTPEIRGKCEKEKQLARKARDYVRGLLKDRAVLVDVSPDKYSGRYDARVLTADGKDVGQQMIASGLARKYDGGKRAVWC